MQPFPLTACWLAPAFHAETASPLGTLDFSRAQPVFQITKGTPEHTRIWLSSLRILERDSLVDFRAYRVYVLEGESFDPSRDHC